MMPNHSTAPSFVRACRRALLCGVAALAFSSPCSRAAADEPSSVREPAATAPADPAEGRRILVTGVVLTGLLIGMERCCSWRLAVDQRRAAANRRTFAEIVPPLTTPARADQEAPTFRARETDKGLPPQGRLA